MTRRLDVLAVLFAAVPFAFALIRAYATGGRDVRYWWVALAAFCGAAAITLAARSYGSSRHAAVACSAAVFLTATLFAMAAAWLLGTVLGPGMLVVASAFGFCFAVSSLVHRLARA